VNSLLYYLQQTKVVGAKNTKTLLFPKTLSLLYEKGEKEKGNQIQRG
jgi:hypothetical protein